MRGWDWYSVEHMGENYKQKETTEAAKDVQKTSWMFYKQTQIFK